MTNPYPHYSQNPFGEPALPGDAQASARPAGEPQAWLLDHEGRVRIPLPVLSEGEGYNLLNGVGVGRIVVEFDHSLHNAPSIDFTFNFTKPPYAAQAADTTVFIGYPGNKILLTDADGYVSSGPIVSLKLIDEGRSHKRKRVEISWITEEHQLRDRVVYPDPFINAAAQNTVSHDRRAGVASTVMMGYARDHASRYADRDRAINGFEMAPDPATGPTINMAERFSNLLDALQRAAIKSGLSFRVRRYWNQGTRFEITQPTTRNIRLASVAAGTASRMEYEVLAPEATTVISGGQGELTARMFRENQDDRTMHQWDRRIEVFRDQRNEGSPEQLLSDGAAALSDASVVQLVTPTTSGISLYRYRVDYELGDTVRVELQRPLGSATIALPVRRVAWTITEHGIRFTPHFAEGGAATSVDNPEADVRGRLRQIETQ